MILNILAPLRGLPEMMPTSEHDLKAQDHTENFN